MLILLIIIIIISAIAYAYSNSSNRKENMLRLVYTVFLAIMVALFVGLGIEAFYPSPKFPEYPTELQYTKGDIRDFTSEQRAIQEKYDKEQKDYREVQKKYSLNASIIIIIASIALLALSLTVLHPLILISDGVLMGGVFTLLYGIARGFMSENDKYRFMVVTIGLVIAVLLGYIRFIKPEKKIKSS